MNIDQELQQWRESWSDVEPPAVEALAAKVRRQSRFMRRMLAIEVLVTISIGGGTLVLAVREGSAEMRVLAAATWAFIAAAWIFGLSNRRGLWQPAALTTSAYLDVTARRCRSAIRSTAFGMVLYAVEMAFCCGWIWRHDGSGAFMGSAPMLGVWAATVVFYVWSARYWRAKRAELEELQRLIDGV